MTINELYQQSLAGDKKAETELFRKLMEGFRVFVHQRVWDKDEIEDIVQNALTTVAAEYKSVAITKSFAAWAYKVIEYRFLAYIQTQRRQSGRKVTYQESDGYGHTWLPDLSLKEKLLKCLREVGQNNRRYARILSLTYQGYTVAEMCGKLRITDKHSYVVLARARSMLRECLERAQSKR